MNSLGNFPSGADIPSIEDFVSACNMWADECDHEAYRQSLYGNMEQVQEMGDNAEASRFEAGTMAGGDHDGLQLYAGLSKQYADIRAGNGKLNGLFDYLPDQYLEACSIGRSGGLS